MSLKTWKNEFYRESAKGVTEVDALGHSLRKWIGLRPENLANHNLKKDSGDKFIHEPGTEFEEEKTILTMDVDTCALCQHHAGRINRCLRCPLHHVRGMSCDHGVESGPYGSFVDDNHPEPMIRLICAAIEKVCPAVSDEAVWLFLAEKWRETVVHVVIGATDRFTLIDCLAGLRKECLIHDLPASVWGGNNKEHYATLCCRLADQASKKPKMKSRRKK